MSAKKKRAPRTKTFSLNSAERADIESRIGHGLSLIVRTNLPDNRSCAREANGFRWPTEGYVEAPDWQPTHACGHGLHGLLWGKGSGTLLRWKEDSLWLIAAVEDDKIIALTDGGNEKIKAPDAWVLFCGDRKGALTYLARYARDLSGVHGLIAAVGNDQGVTGGMRSVLTAGDRGQATAGYSGQATAGDRGQARAGKKGIVAVQWWDVNAERMRLTVGYVGENGIKPNTFYRCDESGQLVEVTP